MFTPWKLDAETYTARDNEAIARADAGCAGRLALNADGNLGAAPAQLVLTLPSDPVGTADDTAAQRTLEAVRGCGNFDITSDHFTRISHRFHTDFTPISQLYATPPAPWDVLLAQHACML